MGRKSRKNETKGVFNLVNESTMTTEHGILATAMVALSFILAIIFKKKKDGKRR